MKLHPHAHPNNLALFIMNLITQENTRGQDHLGVLLDPTTTATEAEEATTWLKMHGWRANYNLGFITILW